MCIRDSGQTDRIPVALPPTDMFREQLEEFGLATRGIGEIEVGVDDALRALAIVHAAIESNERAGAMVEIGPYLRELGLTTVGG